MPIVCLDWETVHLHGEAWISHHRLRHRVFIERQGWKVPTYRGFEYDEFDTPAAKYILWLDNQGHARGVTRLIPTTRPYMVQTLWPQLVDGELPQMDSIWEASRFGCDRNLDSATRRQIVTELICSCQEFGVANGIRKYLSVMPLVIFKHVIMAAGCPVTILGSAKRMEHHYVGAGYIDVSPKTLAAVRDRVGRRGFESAPPLVAGGFGGLWGRLLRRRWL